MKCGACGKFWDPYGYTSRLVREVRESDYYAVYCRDCVAAMQPPPYRVRIRVYARQLEAGENARAMWKYGGYWVIEGGRIHRRIEGKEGAT